MLRNERVAVADKDDPPMTINDELRLTMGQRGNDEDNVGGGAGGLFSNFAMLINVATNDDVNDVVAGAT